jgi:type I restriction-modification system DNA methylase subunit
MADDTQDLISMADIARLAGQRPATVGNWKSRNQDFPPERGRGPRGPLYERAEVTAWLEATNRLDKRPQEAAAIWHLTDYLRGQVKPEDNLPIMLVFLALASQCTPAEWERIHNASPDQRDTEVRSSIRARFPFADELLPRTGLPSQFIDAAVSMLLTVDRDRLPELADALLKQSATGVGHRVHYVAPESVRRLIVTLAEPGGSVYNPATGIGQLMVDAARETASTAEHPVGAHMAGQEADPAIWAMAQLNFAIHGVHADIAQGDVFSEDRFPRLRADTIMAIPPWNQRLSLDERSNNDPRWVFGEPGPNDGNAAWIQHCLYHLADEGRAVLVLPTSALFELGRGGRIRQRIIKAGLLDAVIALPGGVFAPSTSIASAILIFSKKNIDRNAQPELLMVDLSESGERHNRHTTMLSDDLIDEVSQTYRRWTAGDPPDMDNASVAGLGDITANDFVIVPARYQAVVHDAPDLNEARNKKLDLVRHLETLSAASRGSDEQLANLSEGDAMSTFTEFRLGDLASAVTVSRGFPTQRTVSDGDVPVMSVADLRNSSAPRHFADLDAIDEAGLSFAEPGDVLVAIEGGTVGETMIVAEESVTFIPSQQVAVLRVTDDGVVDPWYLGAWFATEPAREQLRRLARGAGIQRIPVRELGSLVVRLPALWQQRAIGRHFRAFETAVKAHQAVAACLEDLRDVELVMAFSDAAERAPRSTDDKAGSHGR